MQVFLTESKQTLRQWIHCDSYFVLFFLTYSGKSLYVCGLKTRCHVLSGLCLDFFTKLNPPVCDFNHLHHEHSRQRAHICAPHPHPQKASTAPCVTRSGVRCSDKGIGTNGAPEPRSGCYTCVNDNDCQ